MAPRLNVIISQPATRDSSSAELEEKLIGELIMSQGLDANLVGPLEHIAADSTDWLCLNGFRGSLALISWLETEQIAEHWQRLGLTGTVRKYGSPGIPGQSIIHIPADVDSTVESITANLLKILDDRSVKTVGINLPIAKPNGKSASNATTAKPPAAQPENRNGTKGDGSEKPALANKAEQTSAPGEAASQDKKHDAAPQSTDINSEDDWASLDDLIDQLDAFDQ